MNTSERPQTPMKRLPADELADLVEGTDAVYELREKEPAMTLGELRGKINGGDGAMDDFLENRTKRLELLKNLSELPPETTLGQAWEHLNKKVTG